MDLSGQKKAHVLPRGLGWSRQNRGMGDDGIYLH